jgi:SAM-dependent methyltransferase
MVEPWNLTIKDWSNVLADGMVVETLSKQLKQGEHLPWSDTLIEFTQDSKDVLDLGSGRGELSATLAMQGKNTTLFDWSDKNLEFSKKLYRLLEIDGQFIQGDMTQPLPFEDASFDTVFSCGVFEYFNDEEIPEIINEIKRITRKRIIILVPNARSIAYRLGKWYLERTKKWCWGGERPFRTLKPYFKPDMNIAITEFTIGTKHSLKFLKMPGGRPLQRIIEKGFNLKDHSKQSRFNQGYILITIGELSR